MAEVSHPGVYIREIPSSSRTIPGISTSTTAFVDYFSRGPMSTADVANARRVTSYREFERIFGGIAPKSEASYGVQQFFMNGGSTAFIVRCDDGRSRTAAARLTVNTPYVANFASAARTNAREAMRHAFVAMQVANVADSVLTATHTTAPDLAPSARLAGLKSELDRAPKRDSFPRAMSDRDLLARILDEMVAIREIADGKDGTDTNALGEALTVFAGALDVADPNSDLASLIAALKTSQDAMAKALEEAQKFSELVDANHYQKDDHAQLTTRVARLTDASARLVSIANLSGFASETAKTRLNDNLPDDFTLPADSDAVSRCAGWFEDAMSAAVTTVDISSPFASAADQSDAHRLLNTAATAVTSFRKAIGRIEADADDANAKRGAIAISVRNSIVAALDAAIALQKSVEGSLAPLRKPYDLLAGGPNGGLLKQIQTLLKAAGDGLDNLQEPPDDGVVDADQIKLWSACIAATDALAEPIRKATQLVIQILPAADDGEDASSQEGWPDVARLTEHAADLADRAALAARDAADATEATAKILSFRIQQFEATSGTTADRARSAAIEVSTAAQKAKLTAEEAANAAAQASRAVTIEQGEEKLAVESAAAADTIEAAIEAAIAARQAAQEVEGAAQEAHLAALIAGEAGEPESLLIEAASPGVWGNTLSIAIARGTEHRFSLYVQESVLRNGRLMILNQETYNNLTLEDEDNPNYASTVVNGDSQMIRVSYSGPRVRGATPEAQKRAGDPMVAADFSRMKGGHDGNPPDAAHLTAAMRKSLDKIAPYNFNLLCLPVTATFSPNEASVAIADALAFCKDKRAFVILDIPPAVTSAEAMQKWMKRYGNADNFNGAVYYPRLSMPDPSNGYRPRNVAASGTLAGIYARTDARRGIWKAPAGIEAVIQGADLYEPTTERDSGDLNPIGVNVLRALPVHGTVCWGARTLAGADLTQSEWKYLNVRRLIYFIEESLYQALTWTVFEPNDTRLWQQVSRVVGKFLSGLYSDGALQGSSADQAYYVHCDDTTTTQYDIDQGIVNIYVGVAPVKPAEFIVVHLTQIAGQE